MSGRKTMSKEILDLLFTVNLQIVAVAPFFLLLFYFLPKLPKVYYIYLKPTCIRGRPLFLNVL